VCTGDAARLVLIETSASAKEGEVTGIFDGSTEIQKNWLDFIVNLLHYKKGSPAYGIESAKYGLKPLYFKTPGGAENTLLNELFCHIFSSIGQWQGLRPFAPKSMADVETLLSEDFQAVDSSKHSIALPRIPKVSKNFVAYIEALVGAAPYYKTTDPRNKLDIRFTKALRELEKQEDMRFDQYVARKLRAWYTMFPPTQADAAAGGTEDHEGAGGADGEEGSDGEEEEAMALSGGE
jgi:hypothetical protein